MPSRKLQLRPPLPPMEALLVPEIPQGPGWQYEPKWDGFRCLVFRDGDDVYLQSKAERPLARYFPEVVAAMQAVKTARFVLDGEIVVPVAGRLAFDELLQRIHPAASRIRKLSLERPALFIAFDLLADSSGKSLLALPLRERRPRLEAFARRFFPAAASIRLSPATTRLSQARKWFRTVGGNLDGVVAKLLDSPYRPGERTAMQKVKLVRSADCVVGGFRYLASEKLVGSLLLGLYDSEGILHHVGFTSNIMARERKALTRKLEKLIEPPGFTGRAPGGPSRWSTKRSSEWQPLAPKLVVEVAYDHFTAGRFRHGTRLLRWRPDKAARQCALEQVERRGSPDIRLLGLHA
ncbi:MAG TPA: ATP-dependent DNA ligase [Gemmataceae bacterium]|nr:ATP-dependent DNA ligase [Gemmataceae bacterium]